MTSLAVASAVFVIALAFVPTLRRDDPDYARFAGDGNGNRANVWTNAAFVIAGLYGLAVAWPLQNDRAIAIVLFAGVVLTGLGSAYFHAKPLVNGATNDWRLLWDRLPMTIAFAAFIALIWSDRVSAASANVALAALCAIGVATTLLWYFTKWLYPYAAFQAYAMLAPLLALFLPARFTHYGHVLGALALFLLAKVLEVLDRRIWEATGRRLAGHPLKHVAGAAAALMIAFWLAFRA